MSKTKVLKNVKWIIDVQEKGDGFQDKWITSSIFNMDINDVTTYWILAYNLNNDSKNDFCVFLSRLSDPSKIKFDISFSASIANDSCQPSAAIPQSRWKNEKSSGIFLLTSKVLKEKRNDFFPDGKLQLNFKITAKYLSESDCDGSAASLIEALELNKKLSNKSPTSEDVIFEMITTLSESDVFIKTDDGTSLKAHRSVLSQKSTVFKSMFTIDMEETANKSVDIIEFKGPVMRELVRFIYFGKVHNIDQVNIELFRAAKVYEIAGLPEICLKSIIDVGINLKNVINIVELADVYDIHQLFNHCCEKIQIYRHHQVIQNQLKALEMKLQIKIMGKIITRMSQNETFVLVETCQY